YQRQRIGKGEVGVVMIEREPALPRGRGQGGQALVKSCPVPQRFEAGGPFLADRGFQVEHSPVANLVNHLEIDTGHGIAKHEVTKLGQDESLVLEGEQTNAQSGLEEDL